MQYCNFKALKTAHFYQYCIFPFQKQTFGSVYSGLSNTQFDKVLEGPANGSKK